MYFHQNGTNVHIILSKNCHPVYFVYISTKLETFCYLVHILVKEREAVAGIPVLIQFSATLQPCQDFRIWITPCLERIDHCFLFTFLIQILKLRWWALPTQYSLADWYGHSKIPNKKGQKQNVNKKAEFKQAWWNVREEKADEISLWWCCTVSIVSVQYSTVSVQYPHFGY